MPITKPLVFIVLACIIAGGIYIFSILPDNESAPSQELIAVDKITHGHGLAVDISDPAKLYIATHHGLMLLKDEKDLFQIGNKMDDYMGFSPHPLDSKVFFASGHPSSGGNLGFQKSEDSGFTWKKVSDGLDGPVDFHAMAVSPVDPDIIYGWHRGNLQRTNDGGKSWQKFGLDFPAVLLAADPKNKEIVYAASPRGLFVSENQGQDWRSLLEGFVSVVAIHPENPQILFSFSEKFGLAKSEDRGTTWQSIANNIAGTALFITIDRQNPSRAYALDHNNGLYRTTNNGETWIKIR